MAFSTPRRWGAASWCQTVELMMILLCVYLHLMFLRWLTRMSARVRTLQLYRVRAPYRVQHAQPLCSGVRGMIRNTTALRGAPRLTAGKCLRARVERIKQFAEGFSRQTESPKLAARRILGLPRAHVIPRWHSRTGRFSVYTRFTVPGTRLSKPTSRHAVRRLTD
jgi:hypothetical protein